MWKPPILGPRGLTTAAKTTSLAHLFFSRKNHQTLPFKKKHGGVQSHGGKPWLIMVKWFSYGTPMFLIPFFRWQKMKNFPYEMNEPSISIAGRGYHGFQPNTNSAGLGAWKNVSTFFWRPTGTQSSQHCNMAIGNTEKILGLSLVTIGNHRLFHNYW